MRGGAVCSSQVPGGHPDLGTGFGTHGGRLREGVSHRGNKEAVYRPSVKPSNGLEPLTRSSP